MNRRPFGWTESQHQHYYGMFCGLVLAVLFVVPVLLWVWPDFYGGCR